ncbi:hypothetical protein D3C75_1140550 [compost metagenome]
MTVKPWTAELSARLQGLPGVLEIREEEQKREEAAAGSTSVTLVCDRDLTAAIASETVQAGAELYDMRRREFGLDEIYHRYFEKKEE